MKKKISLLLISIILFPCYVAIAAEVTKSVNVKYFFPKWGTENPTDDPNWYYYCGQEEPAATTRNYNSSWVGPNNAAAMWSCNIATGVSWITIYRVMSTGFHYCTSKMAHENKHESDFRNEVWPGGFNASQDADNDGLRDAWEVAHPTIVPNHPSGLSTDWNDFNANWFDPRAYAVENAYPDNSATKDWASPGTNY